MENDNLCQETEQKKVAAGTIHRKRANDSYTMIANEILQDKEISTDALSVAVYILSLPSDWIIKPKHIWKAKNIGRDRVYKALDELCELGYMKKELVKRENLNSGYRYHLSAFKEYLQRPETHNVEGSGADFKESLRLPGFQGADRSEAGEQDVYKVIKEEKTHIKKDSVLGDTASTLPSSTKRKEGRAKRKKPKDFSKSLNPEQKALHDELVAYRPKWGEPLQSKDVCAWFLSNKWTVDQVELAFKIYKQDAREALLNGHTIDNMGGVMVSCVKTKRELRNDDMGFNREHAQRAAKRHVWMKVLKQYVKIRAGNVKEEIELNQPKEQFIYQMENVIRKAEIYASA